MIINIFLDRDRNQSAKYENIEIYYRYYIMAKNIENLYEKVSDEKKMKINFFWDKKS